MRWVHLRMCQSCGHIGCCDNSIGKHATAHYQGDAAPDHPLGRARARTWSWCYPDELMFEIRTD